MKMNRIQFQPGLSLNQFLAQYGKEQQCESALEVARWPHGFICPKCSSKQNVLLRGLWLLLKRPENLSEKQTTRLGDQLKLNLSSIKGYLLREDFQRFWDYHRPYLAEKFLDDWVTRAFQTDMEPIKKVAKMLNKHKPLILNWFKAKGDLSSGAVEGMNLKAKLTMRKAYGFKVIKCLEIACITHLASYRNLSTTTDSADEP